MTSTAQDADRVGNGLVATDNVKAEIAIRGAECYVWFSEVKTMIDQVLMKSKKKFPWSWDGWEDGCQRRGEACRGSISRNRRPTVMLAICSLTQNVLDEKVVVGSMQRSKIKAAVRHSILKVVFTPLLENDDLIAPIAIFVSNYVEKESNTVKVDKYLAASKRQIWGLLLYPPTADSLADDEISSQVKRILRFRRDKNYTLKPSSWSADQLYDNKRRSNVPILSDKISYCRVRLINTHSLLQWSYASKPSDLL